MSQKSGLMQDTRGAILGVANNRSEVGDSVLYLSSDRSHGVTLLQSVLPQDAGSATRIAEREENDFV
jgi:hypothetical protein